MKLIKEIVRFVDDLTAIRRDLHANPEIGFEEVRTAASVADKLTAWGVEVHTGIGGTGVVGIIRGDRPGGAIGLRADMDALPMQELAEVPYRSRRDGVFHGCGHDGHTTMLLGAARYLADTRKFPGEIRLIFQPAEEGLGGARAMIADGLFQRFPCHEVYGLHNWPEGPVGRITVKPGIAMAASDQLDISISGRGAHGAQPQLSRDPTIVAVTLAQALQSIVSRNVNPLDAAVLSITKLHAGSAYNVIPEAATLGGTIRTFDGKVRTMLHQRIRELAAGLATAFGVTITVTITDGYRALCNSEEHSLAAINVARQIVGAELAEVIDMPLTGSEDFSDMLDIVPGAYLLLSQGPGASLHNPHYVFNDDIIPIGASLLARIAEVRANVLASSVSTADKAKLKNRSKTIKPRL
jgi:amidohydrolase